MGVSKGRLEIKEIERKINVEKGVERKKHWRIDFLLFAGWPVLETKEPLLFREMVDLYLVQ